MVGSLYDTKMESQYQGAINKLMGFRRSPNVAAPYTRPIDAAIEIVRGVGCAVPPYSVPPTVALGRAPSVNVYFQGQSRS